MTVLSHSGFSLWPLLRAKTIFNIMVSLFVFGKSLPKFPVAQSNNVWFSRHEDIVTSQASQEMVANRFDLRLRVGSRSWVRSLVTL